MGLRLTPPPAVNWRPLLGQTPKQEGYKRSQGHICVVHQLSAGAVRDGGKLGTPRRRNAPKQGYRRDKGHPPCVPEYPALPTGTRKLFPMWAALPPQRHGPHSLFTDRRGLPVRHDIQRSWMAHPPIPKNFSNISNIFHNLARPTSPPHPPTWWWVVGGGSGWWR